MAANVSGAGKPTPRETPALKTGSGAKSSATGSEKTTQPDATKTASRATLADLKKVGRYTIIKKIGQGGMGAVFLANDTQLKRQVALKVLPKDKAENPTLVKRFKAEAQAAAQLKHDNIVAIHDAGEADGLLYIALEFIDGTDAHTIVSKRGPMPAKRAMDVIRQIALALQHAHEQKIVHRDIKPSNLLIAKGGQVKLADMGLARSIDESLETNITRAGTTVGTVDYMSPEQARNSKSADIRSDLYSLGATWFHLLTGHPPFPEGSMLNKLNAHAAKPRPDVRDENDSVSENVAVMIKRLLAVNPEDRYQTPAELLEDLDNENLTRGPMSLKDLAALAEEDTGDDEPARPKAAYKKPEPKESKQLMAPTAEIPVMPTQPLKETAASGFNIGSLKPLMIVVGIAVVIGGLGWLTSKFGGAVATSSNPGSNPFDRGSEDGSNEALSVNEASADNKSGDNDQKNLLTSRTPGAGSTKGPKPLTGSSKAATAKDTGTKPESPQTGSLYLPPLVPLGRDGEVRFVPEWITEAGTPVPATLKTTFVGGGLTGLEQVPTLGQALRELPQSGGVVELVSDGPHFLEPLELRDVATVAIRAATGTRPVLVLVAEPDQPYDALVKLTNASLSLEGLDIRLFSRQFQTSDPLTLIQIRGGDLAAIRCSFTLAGTRPGKTFVFGVEGKVVRSDPKDSSAARLLTRDCLVRGSSLGVFQLDLAAVDLVASRCAFATGASPVLTLTNHEVGDDEPPALKAASTPASSRSAELGSGSGASKALTPKTLKPLGKPKTNAPASTAARSLRFLSSTLLSSATAFELVPGVDPAKPPVTEVNVINSVVAGITGPQGAPVLLALPGWTQNVLPRDNESLYPNLRWVVESSFVCGWQKLILEEAGTSNVVRDGSAWKQIWKSQANLDESQFQASGWPKTPVADWEGLKASTFDVSADVSVKGTDGQAPGSPTSDFVESTVLPLARADALADRAQYPVVGWERQAVNKTIEVNANTQDLGRVLASETLPSGTTLVVVSGTGAAETTPVVVKGKSLRIEFKTTGEAPLVMGPRKSTTMKDDEAMFIVEGGSLELIDGTFRFPNTASEPVPQYFLAVYDGDFTLKGCQVTGQTLDVSSKFVGLIRWKRTQAETKDLTQPAERNSGLIVNSALLTTRRLLDADMRQRTLLLRNSLFASIGDLFDLNVNGFEPRIGATLDARWCTFGAGGKFLFQVRGTKDAEKTTRPFSAFFENSIFLPLTELSGSTSTPTLLALGDRVLSNQQLAWWDHSNGYASTLTQLVRTGDAASKSNQSFPADWNPLWGAGHVERTLSANGAVRLTAKFPHRSKITPKDFVLAADCQAKTWGDNQTSLGAELDLSVAASVIRRPPAGTGSSKPDSSKTPAKSTPSTKSIKPNKLNF